MALCAQARKRKESVIAMTPNTKLQEPNSKNQIPRTKVHSFLVGIWILVLGISPVRAQDSPGVRSIAFSPDGTLLAITTGEPKQQGTVTLWEIATRKERWKHAETDGVPAVAFSPNGQTIAIAVYDGMAKLLDVADGKVEATLKHPKEVRGVAFAPDGNRLATACWDKIVRVWDLASAIEKVTCTGHRDRIFSVSFSPDGKRLLSVGGDDGAKLWDAATGAEKRTLKHYFMPCACFSPDGQWVITGSYDGTTRLWNTETGEQRARFSGTGGVKQLAFSPRARAVAICSFSRDIGLFNLSLEEPESKDLGRIRALLANSGG
jgi:WD40 repeat protein